MKNCGVGQIAIWPKKEKSAIRKILHFQLSIFIFQLILTSRRPAA